jgi:hypothetical protein
MPDVNPSKYAASIKAIGRKNKRNGPEVAKRTP